MTHAPSLYLFRIRVIAGLFNFLVVPLSRKFGPTPLSFPNLSLVGRFPLSQCREQIQVALRLGSCPFSGRRSPVEPSPLPVFTSPAEEPKHSDCFGNPSLHSRRGVKAPPFDFSRSTG